MANENIENLKPPDNVPISDIKEDFKKKMKRLGSGYDFVVARSLSPPRNESKKRFDSADHFMNKYMEEARVKALKKGNFDEKEYVDEDFELCSGSLDFDDDSECKIEYKSVLVFPQEKLTKT
eukprot:CAMPEP_0117756510 /NCGR_PEP_ID=MMETSP0947-20121206/14126_1 /TAXON_ID=44440 /ORGANISM="Chattonella subsalsa, Strain CCMP2191" /LENGTH=121 /DNA_ID=CAMNT_0005576121 /DNA_START=170 /DNA_END=535 /DNA_ORIENTATION=+